MLRHHHQSQEGKMAAKQSLLLHLVLLDILVSAATYQWPPFDYQGLDGQIFQLVAMMAEDHGVPPKRSQIDVTNFMKNKPMFMQGPGSELELSEGSQDYTNPIASYTAFSQIPENPVLFFAGLSRQTRRTPSGQFRTWRKRTR